MSHLHFGGNSHSHGHCHGHPVGDGSPNKKTIKTVFFITFAFFFVELIGGVITNSLALISDALHMLSDAASLGLSWMAIIIALKPPTPKYTFGKKRAEVLAALINALTLIVVSIFIFKEAWFRFTVPPVVESRLMIAIAVTGLLVNLLGAWILFRSNPWDNLNMRGAFLHVIGDALGSVGAIIAGVTMFYTGLYIVDPIVSVLIGAIILVGAIRLLRDTVHVLLEGTPGRIPYEEVRSSMLAVDGVKDVHGLYIWTITSGSDSLNAHVLIKPGEDHQDVLESLENLARNTFGIEYVTIQLERQDEAGGIK